MVISYIPKLEGVLLSHSNLVVPSGKALIQNDCPFAIVDVVFDAVVWAPQVGQILGTPDLVSLLDVPLTCTRGAVSVGTHSLSSPSHLSLLIHKTFNASISLPHIPLDRYIFDEALADTPPPPPPPPSESEAAADEDEDMEAKEDGAETEEKKPVELVEKVELSSGRWKNTKTGKVLGEKDELVKFTVIRSASSSLPPLC